MIPRANRLVVFALIIGCSLPMTLQAHHEAIIGPHAPAFFSNKGFAGFQVFNIAAGSGNSLAHEQVGLVSLGLPLGHGIPPVPFDNVSA